MTPRTFLTLFIITVVTVVAAIWSVGLRPRAMDESQMGAPVIPGLAGRANDVARLEVTEKGTTLTITKGDKGWILPEKGGFAAKIDPIRTAVAGLAQMTLVEPKTDRPDRYDRLGLEDPTTDNSTGKRIVLKDKAGVVLADLIIGRSAFGVGGGGGMFVRRGGETKTWLTSGQVRLPFTQSGWMDGQLLDVPATRVSGMTLTGGGKGMVRLARTDQGWSIARLPSDKTVDHAAADQLAGLFTGLTAEDVTSQPVGTPTGRIIEIQTNDGLTIRLARQNDDKDSWIRIQAEGSTAGTLPEADTINRRTAGFVFRLPADKSELIETDTDTLITTKPAG